MSKQADNVTMSEGGLYSIATKGAKDVIDKATPRVLEAVATICTNDKLKNFTMADMGCADGGTSLDMIRAAITKIRTISSVRPVTVIYADQTANDFNALVNIVHGQTQFKQWLGEFENAYALFSGSSFYLQAVRDQSLDFSFSATAMHWLSKKPCNISNHVHMVGATGEEYNAFAEQAAKDWQTILNCRAAELKSGGKMVLINFCRDEQGRHLGNTGGINMFDTFNEIWQAFLHQGRINEFEYLNMTLPQYYHTVEEFSQPLTDVQSQCYKMGLRLDSIETAVVSCPFAQEFSQDQNLKKFADGLIPTVRSWSQSIFKAGLDSARNDDEKNQLIEDYYGTYHKRVMDNPSGHGMGYVHAYMTISKI